MKAPLYLSTAAVLAVLFVGAARADQTVKLTVRVKDADGRDVPAAHVIVYQEHIRASDLVVRPADYQGDTDQQGIARFEMKVGTGEKLKLSLEIAKENFQTVKEDVDWGTAFPAQVLKQITLESKKPAEELTAGQTTTFTIKVIRKDNQEPIEGAKVEVIWIGGFTPKHFPSQTDGNGKVVIVTPINNDFEVTASKENFGQIRKVIKTGDNYQKEFPLTLVLEKTAGAAITITVKDRDTNNPVGAASIVLDGPGYYTATTDGAGNATLYVPETGTFTVRITQGYYEPLPGGELRLLAGEEKKVVSFALVAKAKKDEGNDVVEVTVLAKDSTDENSTPSSLPGASVKIEGTTAITDSGGQASLKGSYDVKEEVSVSATGYKSQTKTVGISKLARYSSGTGAVTFTLVPDLSENSPIRLIVVVTDPLGRPVAGINVDFLSNGNLLWTFGTNAAGESDFTNKDSPDTGISILRQGITVKVKHSGFKEYESVVPADLLKPANEARRYSVQLEKDWSDLTQAIAAFEAKVAAWNNDVRAVSAKLGSVDKAAAKMPVAQGRVEALLEELKTAQKEFKAKASGASCEDATKLKESIHSLQTEASQEEEKINKALEEANALAATCTTKAEGDTIAAKYRSALQSVGKMGAAGEKAAAANRNLARLAEAMKDGSTLLRQLDQTVEKIENEVSTAKKDTAAAQSSFNDAFLLSKGVTGRRAALAVELEKLRTDYEVTKYSALIPADLTKRLDNLSQLLGSHNNDPGFGKVPDSGKLDSIVDTLTRIEDYKVEADGIVAGFKAATCNVQPMDDEVEEIRTRVTNASFDLGLAADLPAKAQTCDDVLVPDVSRFSDPAAMKAAAGPNMVGVLVAINQAPPAGTTKLFSHQDPRANTKTKRGRLLRIYLYQALAEPTPVLPSPSASPPEELVVVPSVAGAESIEYMRIILDQAGFKSAFRSVTPKKKEDELKFAGQDPPAGEKRKSGSLVVVYINQKFEPPAATPTPVESPAASPSPSVSVSPSPSPSPSSAAATGAMPNLIGLTLEQAMTKLRSNMIIGGDEIGDKPPTPEKALTIFFQTPAAGTKVASDKKVVVTVKRYGSAKTEKNPPKSTGPAAANPLGLTLSGKYTRWTGKVTRTAAGGGGAGGEWDFVIRRRSNGRYDYWFNQQALFDVKIENGKLSGDPLQETSVINQPEIKREYDTVVIENRGGKLMGSLIRHTLPTHGGETQVATAEVAFQVDKSENAANEAKFLDMVQPEDQFDEMMKKVREEYTRKNIPGGK